MDNFQFSSVAVVHSSVVQPADDIWGGVECRIDFDEGRFRPDCLAGLADFSHIEVVFLLHLIEESNVAIGLRHPRNRTDWPKVGIFAQRGRNRPNRIGVTICRLLSVQGLSLQVAGLDAIDGTPVLDVKPYMQEFAARGEVRQPEWSRELMAGYWNVGKGDMS
jgi:tRNA-Thr(GGU) m(6)t(6)A37 methyltransferase TsaA